MKLALVVAGVAAAIVAFAACNNPTGGNTCASTGAIAVDARNTLQFVPDTFQITPTQDVCWQNIGSVTHTVTAIFGTDTVDVTLPPNFTYTRGIGPIGDYPFHCRFHPGMEGLIRVR